MRFHVLGICHTVSSKDYLSCAFTQKVVKFCDMFSNISEEDRALKATMTTDQIIRHKTIHELIHYGHERSDVRVDEHVTVMTDDILIKTYGEYNWKKEFFKHAAGDLCHNTFTANGIKEISKRYKSGDFILCFWGLGHRDIANHFKDYCLVVEPGIGYPKSSSFDCPFKVFESYEVMHVHYGVGGTIQPPWYDCVIPNYFDPDNFEFRSQKDNYFLFLGRMITSKGLDIVIHLAKKMGFRLVIAGQGSLEKDLGITSLPANIEYVGFANLETRKKLMAGAKGFFLPTQYIEPFGGSTLEAMMSGTPCITTDWGVFASTIVHGVTGYRCRTLDHFEWAIRNIDQINPQACRDWAVNNYSLTKVRGMYEEYFDMLIKVKFGKGFYAENLERTELDWLFQAYPAAVPRNPPVIKKPRIAIFTETRWAFGRVSQALQKFLMKYDIDIYDWSQGYKSYMAQYDLIYAMVWDIAHKLKEEHPEIADKVVFSGHGVVDFIKMNLNETKNHTVTASQVVNYEMDPELVSWLGQQSKPFSVVSHELYDRLRQEPFNFTNLYLTQCGVDLSIFSSLPPAQGKFVMKPESPRPDTDPIRVMFAFPEKSLTDVSAHGYDAKRKLLVRKLDDHFKARPELNVELIFAPDNLPMEAMPDYYRLGDIFLCMSHSEGNPLGAFEAGACGLITISTQVGEMPYFIKDNKTGYLIPNKTDRQILADVIAKLTELSKDRNLLRKMKAQCLQAVEDWSWEIKIKQWEIFFDACLATPSAVYKPTKSEAKTEILEDLSTGETDKKSSPDETEA